MPESNPSYSRKFLSNLGGKLSRMRGIGEIGLMMGTGFATEVAGGLAGLASLPFGGAQGAGNIIDRIQNYTYQPTGSAAQKWLQTAAPHIKRASDYWSDQALQFEQNTGLPREVIEALPIAALEIGGGGIAMKGARTAAKQAAKLKHIKEVKSKIGDKGPVQRNIADLIPWEPTKNKPFQAADYPTERGAGILYHGGGKWEIDKKGRAFWHPGTMGKVEDWLKAPGLYATNVKAHLDHGAYTRKGSVDITWGSGIPWSKASGSTSHIIKTDYKNIMPTPHYLKKGEEIRQDILDSPSFMSPHDRDFFKLTNPEKRYWNKKHDEAKQIAISRGVPVGKDQSLLQYFYSTHGGVNKRRGDSKAVRDAKHNEMHKIRQAYIDSGIDGIDFGDNTGAGLATEGHEIVVFNPKVAESILQKTWDAKVVPEVVEARWKSVKKENETSKMPSFDKGGTSHVRREKLDDPTRVGLTRYESVEQALKDFNMGPTVGERVPDLDNPTEAGFRLLDDLEKKLANRPKDRSQEIDDIRHLKSQMKIREKMLTGEGSVEFPMEVWKGEGYYNIFFHSNKVVPRRKPRTKPGEGGAIPHVGKGGPLGRKKSSLK